MKDSTWPNLDGEQYFYSGGSLREYCRKRGELKSRVVVDCAAVKDTQAFQLVYSYRGGKAKNLVDRIRRHYIDDCSEKEHYYLRVHWKRSVDSGYALSKLGEIVAWTSSRRFTRMQNLSVPASMALHTNYCFTVFNNLNPLC
ncbi:hypothetical protein GQ600_10561 [Phytophthora cactorum]|nr:hypothetical protein GQ600_10561 [Phytophthora cactorum]